MSRAAPRLHLLNSETVPALEARIWWMIPLLVTLLALATRLYRVQANGLRSDEAQSLWMASRTLPDLIKTVVVEGHDATPPTFNVLLHYVGLLSQELWAYRMISVLAGVGIVWITYQLAKEFFGRDVAIVSALLLAISPFSIEYAQVARTHALTALLSISSLYFFSQILAGDERRRVVWLYAIFTLAALSTHYLTVLLLVFENIAIIAFFILRRVNTGELWKWLRLQLLIGLAALPLLFMALNEVPAADPGLGQTWLAGPSVTGIARTLILWGTGDPSYGHARFTLPRLASLLVVVIILSLGILEARKRWIGKSHDRQEVTWIVLVWAAFLVPWLLAIGISFFRRIFNEKYFLFAIPLLLISMAWAVRRVRPAIIGQTLLILLIALTLLSLSIYHTSPAGEQWSEAIDYIQDELQMNDLVAVMPGYYVRPVAYYLTGSLPPHDYQLMKSPIVVIGPEGIVAAGASVEGLDTRMLDIATEPAERVWLMTGYADTSPESMAWFSDNYKELGRKDFLGVRVIQGEYH